MIKLKKVVYGNHLFRTQGFRPSRIYGFAYRNVESLSDVYYLFPLNIFVRIIRGIKFRIMIFLAIRSDRYRRRVLWEIRNQGKRKD